MNRSFIQEIFGSLAERGRGLIGLERQDESSQKVDLVQLSNALLSGRGEASGVALARRLLKVYESADKEQRKNYIQALADGFGPDERRVDAAVQAFLRDKTQETMAELSAAAEPRRQEVIRRINRAEGGTAALVRLREDVLGDLESNDRLAVLDNDFVHLFSSWFNRGFLMLRRIDWTTPANILAKIIQYEAVHTIQNWEDLRNRLEPSDRRCFAFFHPQMADEPLVFVEVALTREIPGAIAPILHLDRRAIAAEDANTAVFYSISNCQTGLRGVSFGNFLIKQVVEELRRDLPRLKTFVTLSPVPGFIGWLKRELDSAPSWLTEDGAAVLKTLLRSDGADSQPVDGLREAQMFAAAHYFLTAKTRAGKPVDPVARFHLGNGARLERINWQGDISTNGLKQAGGLMVNYLYDLDAIEANHEAFANDGKIAASPAVQKLLKPGRTPSKRPPRRPVPIRSALTNQSSSNTRHSMSNHLFDRIRSHMPGGEKPFITTPASEQLTYGSLMVLSGQYANALLRFGVKPGDRVAAQVEKSAEAIILYLACVRAGAVFVPLNTAYTLAELDYFVSDAEPRLLVCGPQQAADIAPLANRGGAELATLGTRNDGSLVEAAGACRSDFADIARDADDLAALLYTSGTTGRSKGAMLTHRNLASNAETLVAHWQFGTSDVLLHALPIFHTHGLFVATNVTLMAGASMIFLPKFDPDEIMRLMPQATCFMGVPTFYVRLLQHSGLTEKATQHMRLFVSGSAPLLAETHDQWKARTGHAILERYGMTETNMITSNPYNGQRVPGAVGQPLPGVSLRITEPETGRLLPQGEIGMIEVNGPNVFKGYWRMPEKTESEFRKDGFFITGDLGKIDDAGYVHIVGRGKDLVITGGYNVYPKEVETEIDMIPGVFESAVIGLPHADFGEGVTAVVVRRPGSDVDELSIIRALVGRLAKYKQPKRVIFVGDLPRNAMGKVQKNKLQATYRGLYTPVRAS